MIWSEAFRSWKRSSGNRRPKSRIGGVAVNICEPFRRRVVTTRLSFGLLLVCVISASACVAASVSTNLPTSASVTEDTIGARAMFEENIDAIHKRDRARYLATYLHSSALGRNGAGGLQLGYSGWDATRDSTWPDTLVARRLRVLPIAPGVVYGTYCYTVTEHDTTSSGVSERIFVKTSDGWRIAVTTAFGLPAGSPAQCK
jgi:hypothetical protein